MEPRIVGSVCGSAGIVQAEVESTQRWERRKATLRDGRVVDILPRFCLLRVRLSDGRIFEALMTVRRQLEEQELTLCVQGARKNAWASGMSRDMGGGWKAYLLDPNRDATHDDLVFILDPAECDEVVTVDEQRAWFEYWREHRRVSRL